MGCNMALNLYICLTYTAFWNPLLRRMSTVDIFIAYSHEDLAHKNEFKKFLRPMLREERVSVWDDYDIEAGQEWDAAIKERLYNAGVVVLLVSADSLASDYFYGKEVKVSLERHQKGEVVVVPVILRHCDWENTPLGVLEALPEKGRPVVEWPTRDQAWQDVVTRLRRVVETVAQRQASATARSEQQRRFTAAVQAATQLLEHENWAEARTAFSNALRLHLDGFSPNPEGIQQRIATCDREQARQELENRKAAFDKTLARAGILFSQSNWTEALGAYREAQSQYEPAFPLTEASRRIGERIAACEQYLRAETEAQYRTRELDEQYRRTLADAELHLNRRAYDKAEAAAQLALVLRPGDEKARDLLAGIQNARLQAAAAPPPVAVTTPRWLYLIGGLILILTALAMWKARRGGRESQPAPAPISTPADASNDSSPAREAFLKAKDAGTLPAFAEFLQHYPKNRYTGEAQKHYDDLKMRFDQKVRSARSFEQAEEWSLARTRYREALQLNPGDEAIRRRLDALPND